MPTFKGGFGCIAGMRSRQAPLGANPAIGQAAEPTVHLAGFARDVFSLLPCHRERWDPSPVSVRPEARSHNQDGKARRNTVDAGQVAWPPGAVPAHDLAINPGCVHDQSIPRPSRLALV
jgi:hypothetical protein